MFGLGARMEILVLLNDCGSFDVIELSHSGVLMCRNGGHPEIG